MELRRVEPADVAALREERRRASAIRIAPLFQAHLAQEAEPFLIVEDGEPGREGRVERPLGYALLLTRPHGGHSHVTVVELYLKPEHREWYEDVLDLLREAHRPTAYLVRTDDCALNATLLARGLQVEPTALVMVPVEAVGQAEPPLVDAPALELVAFSAAHMPALRELLAQQGPHAAPVRMDAEERLAELEALAGEGRHWVALEQGKPVAVVARADGGDGEHELIDFALAHAGEAALARAVLLACADVRSMGRKPAAVIDATETGRRRIFRKAGFYSEAAYMVFYDAEAGRPSVATVSLEELKAIIDGGEKSRLVDVLGEAHWKRAHLPGSEWVDFRGLAKEAKRRFALDEPIIVYCDGFT
ncbi:MAG TPA: rhodanese-like domain-containing protein [Thermoleophilia bacterium]